MTLKSLSEAAVNGLALVTRESRAAVISDSRAEKMAARLCKGSPEQNDALMLAKLSSGLNADLVIEKRSTFSEDGEMVGVAVADVQRPQGITQTQIDQALTVVRLSLVPPPEKAVADELARLRLKTACRPGETEDIAARSALYAAELRAYPADVALTVLRQRWKWFPAWSELRVELDRLSAPRRALERIVSSWRPWTNDEERAHLEGIIVRAKRDAEYYRWSNPEKSSECAQAADAFSDKLAEIPCDR